MKRPTIICGTLKDEQMMIAPRVNQASPTAKTHFRPILSDRYPDDIALPEISQTFMTFSDIESVLTRKDLRWTLHSKSTLFRHWKGYAQSRL